jgi:hypothetical protein
MNDAEGTAALDSGLVGELGAKIDELLAGRPEVAARFNQVFQGDAVAEQWLAAVETPEPSATESPEASAPDLVLLDENDVLPLLAEVFRTEIWPALVAQVGEAELAEHAQDVIAGVSEALVPELTRVLAELAVQADGNLRTPHTEQGED